MHLTYKGVTVPKNQKAKPARKPAPRQQRNTQRDQIRKANRRAARQRKALKKFSFFF